jgi:transposase
MSTPNQASAAEPASTSGPGDGPRADRPKRRQFSPEYKRRMVEEYHELEHGEIGPFLRREGLYHSNIREWEAKINAGTLEDPPPRGRPKRTPEQKRIADLEKEVARLESGITDRDQQISDKDAALDVLGKGFAFLEAVSSTNAPSPQTNTEPGKKTRSTSSPD